MKLFDPDPSLRWHFVLPHPDDELAICIWIRRLLREGAEVHLTWMHSTPDREAESRRAIAELGGSPTSMSFLNAPDGRLVEELETWLPHMQRQARVSKPDRVVTAAFEQGHLDHDATNWLVNHSYDCPVLEMPLYHTYAVRAQEMNRFSDPGDCEALPLLPEESKMKSKLARCYPSQTIWRNLVWYEVWQAIRLRPLELRLREVLRLQTHFDFAVPDHPDRLRQKVEETASWKKWVQNIERIAPRVPALKK